MSSFRGMGLFGSIFGHAPARDEWAVLNPELMDMLFCMYRSSLTLQTLVTKLTRETMRGGVAIRETTGTHTPAPPPSSSGPSTPPPPSAPKSKKKGGGGGKGGGTVRQLSPGDQARLGKSLKRAVLYGLLYGLVPAALDSQNPGVIRVPPPESGRFVGRMDAHGIKEFGWQWRDRGMGADSAAPDRDVWVFVWEDKEPVLGLSAPFRSAIQPLLPELMREQELVEADTQANYELSYPPFVLQENPRSQNETPERQVIELYMNNYLGDPTGDTAGHGPGGTLIGDQRNRMRSDVAGSIRASRSLARGDRGFAGNSMRMRIDPCGGEIKQVHRSLVWQRGAYTTPTGWLPTAGFARPTLRSDLLAQRAYVTQMASAALGVPALFAYGGSEPPGGPQSTGTGAHSKRTGIQNGALQQSAACEAMRDTVSAVRTELSAFYAQAHFRLMWAQEAVGLSREVALGESLIQDDPESTSQMARQLELVGDTLRVAFENRHEKRLRQTAELHRAAEIADQASKLWRGQLMQQRIDAVLHVVAGVDSGTVGFPGDMTIEGQEARERRGEGLQPAATQQLRDPEDRQGDMTEMPRSKKWIETGQSSRIDPNERAEPLHDKRERTKAEGRRVAGSTLLPRGDESGRSGYERRALTEELPDLADALQKARDMVDARIEQMDRLRRGRERLAPASGERGETKVELVWLSTPVPDWPMLRELALDDVLDPRVFQRTLLQYLGFDPFTASSKRAKPFARVDEQLKPKPAGTTTKKPTKTAPKADKGTKRAKPDRATKSADKGKEKGSSSSSSSSAKKKQKTS